MTLDSELLPSVDRHIDIAVTRVENGWRIETQTLDRGGESYAPVVTHQESGEPTRRLAQLVDRDALGERSR